jgi:hypothetical protein
MRSVVRSSSASKCRIIRPAQPASNSGARSMKDAKNGVQKM